MTRDDYSDIFPSWDEWVFVGYPTHNGAHNLDYDRHNIGKLFTIDCAHQGVRSMRVLLRNNDPPIRIGQLIWFAEPEQNGVIVGLSANDCDIPYMTVNKQASNKFLGMALTDGMPGGVMRVNMNYRID